MDVIEIKCARIRKEMTAAQVAEKIGIKASTYRAKENGTSRFTDAEKVKLAEVLGWDYAQMNKYLYGGVLPDIA